MTHTRKEAIAPLVPQHIMVVIGYGRHMKVGQCDWDDGVVQIKRHVDGVHSAEIIYQRECRHCGNDPEFGESSHDPGPFCCDPAQAEWEAGEETDGVH